MNGRRLYAVMLKEVRQMRRDRITLAMIVAIPVMQLLLFGYAINTNLRDLKAGVADQANTAGSRALVMDVVATTVVKPTLAARTPDELMEAMRRGQISIGIVIPPDFERRRSEGRELMQVLVDGSDNAVQSAAAQLAQIPVNGTRMFAADLTTGWAAVAAVVAVVVAADGLRSRTRASWPPWGVRSS